MVRRVCPPTIDTSSQCLSCPTPLFPPPHTSNLHTPPHTHTHTHRTSTADGNDSLDLTRWDLPVGRKGGPSETWELVWKQQEGPGKLQRLVFEGSTAACTMITKQIEGWHTLAPEQVQPAARSMPGSTRMGGPVGAPTGEDASEGDAQEQGGNEGGGEKGDDEEKGGSGEKEEGDGMDAPLHLVPGPTMPQLSEPSQLLTDVQVGYTCTVWGVCMWCVWLGDVWLGVCICGVWAVCTLSHAW